MWKRNKDELFRLITENAGDVVWILDLEKGTFSYVSPAVYNLRGYTPEEVLNQTMAEVMTRESYQYIQDNFGPNLEKYYAGDTSMRVTQHEIDQLRKDGSVVHTEVVLTLLPDHDGIVREVLGLSRDITERKLAAQEIASLNAQLEQRIRERTTELEAINRELEAFTYSVSHDLRAPLRAIGGFSRILSTEYAVALDVEGRRMLSVIESNIRKMDHLITDLLSLSRITRINGIRHKVNMEFMVRNLYDSLVTEEDREHITFTVSPMPAVLCDPIMMEHVWSNLISNAIKFTSPRIHRIIEVSAKGTRDYVEFSVRDNGVGFNPKNAGKLFEIFQRLHNAHEIEGTGVGLAIVKRVIDHHKGKVWAESKEGEGAAFYFTLPAGEESFIHR